MGAGKDLLKEALSSTHQPPSQNLNSRIASAWCPYGISLLLRTFYLISFPIKDQCDSSPWQMGDGLGRLRGCYPAW